MAVRIPDGLFALTLSQFQAWANSLVSANRAYTEILLLGRCKFTKVLDSEFECSMHALEQIRQLYAIEQRLRTQKAAPKERHRVR